MIFCEQIESHKERETKKKKKNLQIENMGSMPYGLGSIYKKIKVIYIKGYVKI